MGDHTGISWTDATANVVVGCSRVSEGCRSCYAERLSATRLKHTDRYKGLAVITEKKRPQWTGEVRLVPEAMAQVLRWQKPRKIFLTAMGDPFHAALSTEDIECLFGLMHVAGQHTFQVLTKRPKRMLEFLSSSTMERCLAEWTIRVATMGIAEESPGGRRDWTRHMPSGWEWPPPNVWLGTSCEDQATAEERLPLLARCPGTVRFVSAEPLLERIDLGFDPDATTNRLGLLSCPRCRGWGVVRAEGYDHEGFPNEGACPTCKGSGSTIDWWIVGGESGREARPFLLDWARELRDRCAEIELPFFFKQAGAHPVDGTVVCATCGHPRAAHAPKLPSPCMDGASPLPQGFARETDPAIIARVAEEHSTSGCRCIGFKPATPAGARIFFKDGAGADPSEWPEDLHVQQFPSIPQGTPGGVP